MPTKERCHAPVAGREAPAVNPHPVVEGVSVRQAVPADLGEVAAMCRSLWPEVSVSEHAQDFAPLLAGKAPGNLPAIVLVAQDPAGRLVGFIYAGLRSHADGCDPSHAVGYVEGWYVEPSSRCRHVGAQLVSAAEEWARSQGCREMASDTWVDNVESQLVHEALGFEVVDRCVHYRKRL